MKMFNQEEKIVKVGQELEIAELKKEITKIVRDEIEGVVKSTCLDVLMRLMDSDQDTEWKTYGHYSIHGALVDTVTGRFKKSIINAVSADWDANFKDKAMEFIDGEEFIDSVVKRIKKKQI